MKADEKTKNIPVIFVTSNAQSIHKFLVFFFFQAEDDIRDATVTGVQTCALPISAYEICTFQALRERLRCKEIWVEGADRWRNPDEDLPADFEDRRVEHYTALRKPLDPTAFIDELQDELRGELATLDEQLPGLD